MPFYNWSCLSCGASNLAQTTACKDCGCPASVGAKELLEYREKFLQNGGTVGPAAAPTLGAEDYAVLKAFLSLPLIIFGWLPTSWFKKSRNRVQCSNLALKRTRQRRAAYLGLQGLPHLCKQYLSLG